MVVPETEPVPACTLRADQHDLYCQRSLGRAELNPSIERLRELLQSLDIEDKEHPDVALKYETEWCLSAISLWAARLGERRGPRTTMQCI
jgi:hypothetical protein